MFFKMPYAPFWTSWRRTLRKPWLARLGRREWPKLPCSDSAI